MERQLDQMVCDVDGRSILIRSWFDADSNRWRASAPTCSYAVTTVPIGPVSGNSREEVVEELMGLLTMCLVGVSC